MKIIVLLVSSSDFTTQAPSRIVWMLGWEVENSDTKCEVRVENSVQKEVNKETDSV